MLQLINGEQTDIDLLGQMPGMGSYQDDMQIIRLFVLVLYEDKASYPIPFLGDNGEKIAFDPRDRFCIG